MVLFGALVCDSRGRETLFFFLFGFFGGFFAVSSRLQYSLCREHRTLIGSCVTYSQWRPEPAEIWIPHNPACVCVLTISPKLHSEHWDLFSMVNFQEKLLILDVDYADGVLETAREDPTLNSWIELCVQKDWHDQWTVYSNVLWVKKHPNSGSWTVVDGWMYRNVLMYILGVSSLRVQRSIVFNPSIIHGCCSNVSYVSGISSFCAGKLLQERRLVDLLPSSWRSPAAGFGADDGINASSEEGGHCDCSHQGYCD